MTIIPFPRRSLFGALLALLTPTAMLGGLPHPDAELLRLCAEYRRLEKEYRRLSDATDIPDDTPGYADLWALYEENIAQNRDALTAIAETPAHTPAGLRAKASTLIAFYTCDDGKPGTTYARDYPVHAALWSLVEDAGRAGA